MALTNLPKDLDETYARCLARINNRHLRLAPYILRWICAAIRPFTVIQLREALAIDPTTGVCLQDMMPPAQEVLRCCANLITRDSEDHVLLAHHSVRQFLLTQCSDTFLFHEGFSLIEGRLELGKLCIAHLCSSHYSLSLQNSTGISSDLSIRLKPTAVARLTERIPSLVRSVLPMPREVQLTIPRGITSQPQSFTARPSPSQEYLPSFFHFARDQWAPLTLEISEKHDFWHDFRTLSLRPDLVWRIHPWPPHGQSLDSHYLGLLGWSVANRHMPMLELLMDPGGPNMRRDIFEIPMRYYGNLPALHLAARGSDTSIVERLLDRCDPQKRDLNGRKPWHHAAEAGSWHVVLLLTNRKATSLNSRDNKRRTALHLAAENGRIDVVEYLLALGEKINVVDEGGLTAVNMAAKNGHMGTALFLLRRGAVLKSEQHFFEDEVRNGNLRYLEFLRDHGQGIDRICGDITYRAAVEYGQEAVVNFILDWGASVHKFSLTVGYGTPLHLAAFQGHEAAVKILLDRGASTKAVGKYDPLSASVIRGHVAVVKLLLDRDPEITSKKLTAMLGLAEDNRHWAIAQLIKEFEASIGIALGSSS